MKTRAILSHPEDIHCVVFHFVVLLAYAAAFWLHANRSIGGITSVGGTIAFHVAAIMLLGWISAVDVGVNFHNHAHVPIFRHAWMNRWFARQWTVVGGWPAFLWQYTHVNVHHARLLGPGDWTLPRRHADGRFESVLTYVFLHWPWRYAVALAHELRTHPGLRRRAIREIPIFLLLWSIPFWIDPVMALFLWVLPQWFANTIQMGTAMYAQHVGCVRPDTEHPHHHSNEYRSWLFNATMFNIGYHIEHHESGSVHWSELPQLHARMLPELEACGSRIRSYGYYGASRRITDLRDLDRAYDRFCRGEGPHPSMTTSDEAFEAAPEPRRSLRGSRGGRVAAC